MNIQNKIYAKKEEILQMISRAAAQHDTDTVITKALELKGINSIDENSSQTSVNANKINDANRSGARRTSSMMTEMSAKKKGAIRKTEFVETAKHKGIILRKIKGSTYKNEGGEEIGLAFASEKMERWFLGLKKGIYLKVVLLCETSDGEVHPIIIPTKLYKENESKLSRDKNGQMKFNILLNNGESYWKIPSADDISIGDLINNFDLLKPTEYQKHPTDD